MLSRAGLQIPQGKSVLLLSSKLKFYKSLVLPQLMYGAAESWASQRHKGHNWRPSTMAA